MINKETTKLQAPYLLISTKKSSSKRYAHGMHMGILFLEKFDEEWAEHVGWPHVRQGWCVFFSILRRLVLLLARLLLLLLTSLPSSQFMDVELLLSPILSMLLLEDDCEKKLPTLLPKRRIRLPSNLTLPILIPSLPLFVGAED